MGDAKTANRRNSNKSSGKIGGARRGRPAYDDVLTPGEWRVVHAAKHGLTNKVIAQKLGISLDGVKYHIANAVEKLQLKNKAALLLWMETPKGSALALAATDSSKMTEKESPEMTVKESPEVTVSEGNKVNDSIKKTENELSIESLGQVSRTVKDLEQTVNFYQNNLGLTHLYSFGNLAFFDLNGTRLILTETEEPNASESILYFKVSNIIQSCEVLSNKGVKLTHAPHLIHTHEDGSEEWMAFIEDPEARPLGLMSVVSK